MYGAFREKQQQARSGFNGRLKLVYFDARGRAETIRFILAAGRVPYEDKRITFDEWPVLKQGTHANNTIARCLC